MNLHRKIGGVPAWGWGLAVVGGLVLGIYLRRRAKGTAASANPNQGIADYLTAAQGGGIADPNAGLNSDLIGLLSQQTDALTAALLALGSAGGGGTPPATPGSDPGGATAPSVSVASSGGSGASPNPNPAAPAPSEPTFSAPQTQTLDVTSGGAYLGTVTAPVLPIGAPAADYYTAVGLAPSSPFTLLPGGSSSSTSSAAQLAEQAQGQAERQALADASKTHQAVAV